MKEILVTFFFRNSLVGEIFKSCYTNLGMFLFSGSKFVFIVFLFLFFFLLLIQFVRQLT